MYHNDGQGRRTISLPMAPAAQLDAGFDFDAPLFARTDRESPPQKKTGDRLLVSAAQSTTGDKWAGSDR